MTKDLAAALERLGLPRGWVDEGLVDEEFLATVPGAPADGAERRIPVYARFFGEHNDGISEAHLATFLELVALEPDAALREWALGWLVEHEALSLPQLSLLRQHSLVSRSEKLNFFLRRNLEQREASGD